jgi:hypothetical protein
MQFVFTVLLTLQMWVCLPMVHAKYWRRPLYEAYSCWGFTLAVQVPIIPHTQSHSNTPITARCNNLTAWMRRLAEQKYTRACYETRFIAYKQTLFNRLLALICVCRVKYTVTPALLKSSKSLCFQDVFFVVMCYAETKPGFFQIGDIPFMFFYWYVNLEKT